MFSSCAPLGLTQSSSSTCPTGGDFYSGLTTVCCPAMLLPDITTDKLLMLNDVETGYSLSFVGRWGEVRAVPFQRNSSCVFWLA